MSLTTRAEPNGESRWMFNMPNGTPINVEIEGDNVLFLSGAARRVTRIPLRDLTALASAAAYEHQRRALKAEAEAAGER